MIETDTRLQPASHAHNDIVAERDLAQEKDGGFLIYALFQFAEVRSTQICLKYPQLQVSYGTTLSRW